MEVEQKGPKNREKNMLLIKLLPQHIDRLRVAIYLAPYQDTEFMNWEVGFVSTRKEKIKYELQAVNH